MAFRLKVSQKQLVEDMKSAITAYLPKKFNEIPAIQKIEKMGYELLGAYYPEEIAIGNDFQQFFKFYMMTEETLSDFMAQKFSSPPIHLHFKDNEDQEWFLPYVSFIIMGVKGKSLDLYMRDTRSRLLSLDKITRDYLKTTLQKKEDFFKMLNL